MFFNIVSCAYLVLCSCVFHIGNVLPYYQSGGDRGDCKASLALGVDRGYQAEKYCAGAGEKEAVIEGKHKNESKSQKKQKPVPGTSSGKKSASSSGISGKTPFMPELI